MASDLESFIGTDWAHICVDMQRLFCEPTDWQAPWALRVLPAIEELVEFCPERTVFTRFVPPDIPQRAPGAWRDYYRHWHEMTRRELPAELLDLHSRLARFVPPGIRFDKNVYSPWMDGRLHAYLRSRDVTTVVVTGGETEICVLATVLGAMDLGYRVVTPTDGLCSSADETHDAMIVIYRSRFAQQLRAIAMEELLQALPR